jgi:hypothetical protein
VLALSENKCYKPILASVYFPRYQVWTLFGLADHGSLVIVLFTYVYTLKAVSHYGDHEPAVSNNIYINKFQELFFYKGYLNHKN